MLFLGAISFVLLYTTQQVVGFSLATGLATAMVVIHGLYGAGVRVNRKDALYALYAAIALIPALRFWDSYDFTFYLRVVLYPWVVSIIFQNIKLDALRLKIWAAAVMVVVVATVGVMLFQVSPGEFDVSLRRLLTLDRTRGFYYRGEDRIGPNAAAAMCVAGIGLTLAMLKFQRWSFPLASMLLTVLGVLLLVSGGRIATVSAATLVLLYAVTDFSERATQRIKHWMISGAVTLLMGVAAISMYEVLARTQGSVFEERVEGMASPLEDHNLLVRFADWARAYEMIEAEPWGMGFNAYYAIYERTPHNEVLGQWIGGGWAGALLYFAVFTFLTLRSGIHVFRRTPRDVLGFTHYLSLSLLTVTWLAMVTEHISRGGMNTFYPIVWMAVGLSFAVQRDREPMSLRSVGHKNADVA